jgi:predicted GNAT family N-acyltransferase
MTQPIRLSTGDWTMLGKDAASIRVAVFVEEQGIPADLEWDESDAISLHCVAYDQDRPVGTGRLLPDAHIGRMAVLASDRHRRVGGRILRNLIAAAQARGDLRIELSAQQQVVGFYQRHGFSVIGEPYSEVGIAHRRMVLELEAVRQDNQA